MANKILDPVDFEKISEQAKVASNSAVSDLVTTSTAFNIITAEQFQKIQENLIASISNIQQDAAKRVEGSNLYGVSRSPWVFATFDDVSEPVKLETLASNPNSGLLPSNAIIWAANPKSVSWSINQRGTETKNKSGTVLHMWRDRLRNSDFDDPKLTFQFNAGNILPSVTDGLSTSGTNSMQPSEGLYNFYKFLQLVDSPKISTQRKANLVHILYRSRIFPSMMLTGFFDPQVAIQFTDDSQNPNTISGWSATFTVYSTVPKLNSFKQLTERFEKEGLAGF